MSRFTVKDLLDARSILKSNIWTWVRLASPDQVVRGSKWYGRANVMARFIASQCEASYEVGAGIIAVLSPQLNWISNLDLAYWLVTDSYDRRWRQTQRNIDKAYALLTGELKFSAITGAKVKPFALNINGNGNALTIDRHMLRVMRYSASDNDVYSETDSQLQRLYNTVGKRRIVYSMFADIAHSIGYTMAELQAICWISFKEAQGMLDSVADSQSYCSELWFELCYRA